MSNDLIIKPFNSSYIDTILSWTNDKKSFYRWSAGVLGSYPIDSNKFNEKIKEMKQTKLFYPYVVKLDNKVVGFFTLRYRVKNVNNLTIGFVILDPLYRGMGYGKKLLNLAINLAFETYKSDSVNLRVFKDNTAAYNCYKKVGLKENGVCETYNILDYKWDVVELEKRS
ncbi:MAG: GNAT family N-acetyltransferase [bacterium]|nr:GNAT family N-acetyltransferase [bacterium]